jgi:ankyrin repeat protein
MNQLIIIVAFSMFSMINAMEKDSTIVREFQALIKSSQQQPLSEPVSCEELVKLARVGKYEELQQLLKRDKSQIDAKFDNTTALHAACVNSHKRVVKVLLAWGANYTIPDAMGRLPKQIASDNKCTGIAELIEKIEKNADKLKMITLAGFGPQDEVEKLAGQFSQTVRIKAAKKRGRLRKTVSEMFPTKTNNS